MEKQDFVTLMAVNEILLFGAFSNALAGLSELALGFSL